MKTLKLSPASLATVSGAGRIICEQGTIWLTDDGHDVVLQKGETWEIRGQQAVVIEAFSTSKIRFEARTSLTHDLQQLATHYLSQFSSSNRHPQHSKTA